MPLFPALRVISATAFGVALSIVAQPACADYIAMDGARHAGPSALRPGERFIHIPSGQNAPISVAGRTLEIGGASALIGSSSDAIYVAVASGSARIDGMTAGAGEAILLPPYGVAPSIVTFDAERMAAMFGPQAPEPLQGFVADLASVAEEQSWGLFFGRYQRSLFDLNNPGGARTETGRVSVMGAPEVVRIRYSGVSDPTQVEAMVVERARAALAARDANALAQLLDPAPYGGDDLSGGGEQARLVVARELVSQYGGSPSRGVTLRTRPFSDFVFISAVE